jgi:ribosome assembly protein 1
MINKMDRLILELRLSPSEAAQRLAAIVHHANMIWSAFDSEAFLSEADAVLAYEQQRAAEGEGGGSGAGGDGGEDEGAAARAQDDQEEADAFRPSDGNVAFGSAHDGWAFTVPDFAAQYAEKLGAKPVALAQALWGDYTYLPKEKRVARLRRGAARDGSGQRTMFEVFALDPLWKAYGACDLSGGAEAAAALAPIVKGRGLAARVPQKALEANDPRQALRAVLRAWLPLSEAVLGMAVRHLPSPPEAAPFRLPRLLGASDALAAAVVPASSSSALAAAAAPDAGGDATDAAGAAAVTDELTHQLDRIRSHLAASSSAPDAPLVIYVSKMISIPSNLLPRRPGEPAPAAGGNDEVFLAFGRVFSGVAREGARVHVLTSAYDPREPSRHRQTAVLRGLYLMMGRALERLPAVPAGNVLAMAGLEAAVLKTATLAGTPCARPLAPMVFQVRARGGGGAGLLVSCRPPLFHADLAFGVGNKPPASSII